MPSRKKPVQPPLESISVKLKPVLGIPPRQYVPALWSLALITVVFLLLILPGFRRNGTFLTFHTLPPDASVAVDGVRLGASGNELFVRRGHRSLTVSRPGFADINEEIEVRGRVFASRLLPRRGKIDVVLIPLPDADLFEQGFLDFAAWTATGPERERYAIPPSLTTTARDMLASPAAANADQLTAALPLAMDERHLADILRARTLLISRGAPPGIVSLSVLAGEAADLFVRERGMYDGVLSLIDPDRIESLGIDVPERAAGYADILTTAEEIYGRSGTVPTVRDRTLGGRLFVEIPAISAPVGDLEAVSDGYRPRSGAVPVVGKVDRYYIAALETDRAEFTEFLRDRPEWSAANIETLIASNLADDGYLNGWSADRPPDGTTDLPVTDVSWHAAVAYADWFTGKYLAGSGLVARLPSEDEWEIAGRLNGTSIGTADLPAGLRTPASSDTGILNLIGMAGNVREWCTNPWRYNENLFRTSDGRTAFDTPDMPVPPLRSVRGGSHIDDDLRYPVAVRGGLAPEICSPVIGFRLVLIESQ